MSGAFSRRPGQQVGDPAGGSGNVFAPVSGLSALATELAELPIGPSAAFRERLRADLVEEAARRAVARAGALALPASSIDLRESTRRFGSPARRLGRRVAAAGVAAALTAGGVSAAAAGHAIPGDALYPVKRFGESVQASLDPSTGTGPALHRLSTRIGEVESIAALDPTGAQPERWTGADAALRDADAALTSAITLGTPAGLQPDLASSRIRLQRLLQTVPAAHRPGVQSLLDVIDGLPDALPPGADVPALPYGLLPPGRLDLGQALSDGWPLDPALALPAPPAVAVPSVPSTPTGSPAPAARSAAGGISTGSGSAPSRGTVSSARSPQFGPLGGASPSGAASGSRTASGSRSASSGTGSGGVLGRAGSATRSTTPRATGSVVSGAAAAAGDASDAVNQLPRIVSPTVSGITKHLTSGTAHTP